MFYLSDKKISIKIYAKKPSLDKQLVEIISIHRIDERLPKRKSRIDQRERLGGCLQMAAKHRVDASKVGLPAKAINDHSMKKKKNNNELEVHLQNAF